MNHALPPASCNCDSQHGSAWEMQQDLAQLHLKLEDFAAARTIYESLLRADHPDNWAFWLGLLDADVKGCPATAESVAATLALAEELHTADPRLRGPCLVPIEVPRQKLWYTTDLCHPGCQSKDKSWR